MYLLDTNVVLELRRPRPHGGVLAWLSNLRLDGIFVSTVTLGELQVGVERARQLDPTRAQEIEAWVDSLAESFSILPMDEPAFRRWAQLMHGQPQDLLADAMIAVTALINGLTVATCNVGDFERLGLAVFNPFQHRP